MTITLTPEIEQKINERVQNGRYASASDVIQEAFRVLEEQEQLEKDEFEELKRKIEEGLAEADRGELVSGKEFFAELIKKHKASRGNT